MIEEMVGQALYTDDGVNFDHSCLSTYEDACDFLARARPERWKLTSRGVREVQVDGIEGDGSVHA